MLFFFRNNGPVDMLLVLLTSRRYFFSGFCSLWIDKQLSIPSPGRNLQCYILSDGLWAMRFTIASLVAVLTRQIIKIRDSLNHTTVA